MDLVKVKPIERAAVDCSYIMQVNQNIINRITRAAKNKNGRKVNYGIFNYR